MWEYVIGGATVFALIMGLFSIYNGRVTRRYIGGLIRELSQQHNTMVKQLEIMVKHLDKLSEQHTTMMDSLRR
jgi:hypothetical protein